MADVIIYEPTAGTIAVIRPAQEVLDDGKTVAQVGVKDVPHNSPFKIIDDSTLPTDRIFRSAWEWTGTALSTDNDGVGNESNEFE